MRYVFVAGFRKLQESGVEGGWQPGFVNSLWVDRVQAVEQFDLCSVYDAEDILVKEECPQSVVFALQLFDGGLELLL